MPTVIQSGQREKSEIDLTISFPRPFTSAPSVVVTGLWDGGPRGVERPDILHIVNTNSFRVHSDNRTSPGEARYIIHWMARGNVR